MLPAARVLPLTRILPLTTTLLVTGTLLAGCVSAPGRESAAVPPPLTDISAGASEDDATFAFMLESVRLEVLIERAFAGAGIPAPIVVPVEEATLADPPADPPAGEQDDAARLRGMRDAARTALNGAALGIVALRGAMCANDLIPAAACGATALPPIATRTNTLAELKAIGQDLWERAEPFLAEGCRRGVAETGDALFCSVE